jgi:hypothetical protein
MGVFLLSGRGIDRAKDAVEDNMGLACDEDTAAGADCDLMSLARLAVRSTNEVSGAAGAGDAFGGVLSGFAAGLRTFSTTGVDSFSPACEAHIDATAATFPPRPPRADRISYFAAGSSAGGKAGKGLQELISACLLGGGGLWLRSEGSDTR